MTREPTNQFRDENPHQGPSHSFGIPSETRERARPSEHESTMQEREQPISARRESRRAVENPRRGPVSSLERAESGGPFTMMRRLADDMDRLFEEFAFGGDLASRGFRGSGSLWSPQVETFRRGDELVVRADLPGLSRDDIEVEVDDGVLTIHGERNQEQHDEDDGYYRTERSYGRFSRSIALPEGADPDRCDAMFKDGVLEITIPTPPVPQRRARRLQVK